MTDDTDHAVELINLLLSAAAHCEAEIVEELDLEDEELENGHEIADRLRAASKQIISRCAREAVAKLLEGQDKIPAAVAQWLSERARAGEAVPA